MATTKARDLEADLAICESATPGPWLRSAHDDSDNPTWDVWAESHDTENNIVAFDVLDSDMAFIAEARTGWPYAIRRAKYAEREIDRLHNELNILQQEIDRLHRSHCYD